METEKKPLLQVVENKVKSSEVIDGGERSIDVAMDKAGEERTERFDASLPLAVQTTLLKERIAQRERELTQARESSRREQQLRIDSEKELIRLQEQLKYQQLRADLEKANIAQSLAEKELESQDLDRSVTVYREEIAGLRRQMAEVTAAGRIADEELLDMNKRFALGEAALLRVQADSQEKLDKIEAQRLLLEQAVAGERQKYVLVCEQSSLLRKRVDAVNADVARAQLEVQFELGQRQAREQELETLQGRLTAEQALFSQQLEALEQSVVEKASLARAAQEEITVQTEKIAGAQAAIIEAEQKYLLLAEKAEEQVAQINAELEHARRNFQAEQTERQVREQELETLRGRLTAEQARFAQQLEALEQSVVEKESLARAAQEEITVQTEKLAGAQAAINEAEQKYLLFAEKAEEQVAQINAELEHVRRNYQEEQAERQVREQELSALKEVFSALQARLTEEDQIHSSQLVEKKEHLLASQQKLDKQLIYIDKLKDELEIAQSKRSGHYAHLEVERKKNKVLTKRVELLEKDNKRMSSSLSLAVGTAIVKTKTLKDVFLLPKKLIDAVRKHKEKLRLKDELVAFQPLAQTDSQEEKNALTDPKLVSPEAKQQSPSAEVRASDSVVAKTEFPAATNLMILGWPLPAQDEKIRIMSVFDEFSRECFAPQANLIEPRPDNWLPLLERDQPEFLFVESTWRGNKSTWQYRVAKYAHPPGTELSEMVAEFKGRGLPTIFWNKEDPVHFDNFIHAAQEFDYIFTTAEEAVPRYAQRSKAKISVLPFAAEVGLHNPIGSAHRNDKVCFAGSFYANRFSERRDDQLMLLDAASHFDLDIYDRNADANMSKDFCFPERFNQFIRGKLSYDEMSKAYRNYRVFLNVNSVIDSKTMFSRRVFELLACGTPIVSTISAGIEDMFGPDLVWMVKDEGEAREAVQTLLNSPDEWRRRSLQGIRAVFAQHTFAHRFQDILRMTGLRDHCIAEKRVLLTAEVHSQRELDVVIDSYNHQILVNTKAWLFVVARVQGVSVVGANIELVHSQEPLSGLVPKEVSRRQASHIAFLAPTALYGAYYLQDILHAFDYSDAWLVGKPCSGEDTYAYGEAIVPAGSVLSSKALDSADFSASILDGGNLAAEVARIGAKVFMSDAANFIDSTIILAGEQRSIALQKIEI